MAHETVMSTPIFDQLLREMAEHADPPAATPSPPSPSSPPAPGQDQSASPSRRRHRAD